MKKEKLDAKKIAKHKQQEHTQKAEGNVHPSRKILASTRGDAPV